MEWDCSIYSPYCLDMFLTRNSQGCIGSQGVILTKQVMQSRIIKTYLSMTGSALKQVNRHKQDAEASRNKSALMPFFTVVCETLHVAQDLFIARPITS